MDIKRTVLILGLAIVSYALVVQWNNDYGDAAETATYTQSAIAADLPVAQTAGYCPALFTGYYSLCSYFTCSQEPADGLSLRLRSLLYCTFDFQPDPRYAIGQTRQYPVCTLG